MKVEAEAAEEVCTVVYARHQPREAASFFKATAVGQGRATTEEAALVERLEGGAAEGQVVGQEAELSAEAGAVEAQSAVVDASATAEEAEAEAEAEAEVEAEAEAEGKAELEVEADPAVLREHVADDEERPLHLHRDNLHP